MSVCLRSIILIGVDFYMNIGSSVQKTASYVCVYLTIRKRKDVVSMNFDELYQLFESDVAVLCKKGMSPSENERSSSLENESSPMVSENREPRTKFIPNRERREKIKDTLHRLAKRSSIWQTFKDWVSIMALMLSCSYDPTHKEAREKELEEIGNRYPIDEGKEFLGLFVELMEIISYNLENHIFEDILGELYMDLGLSYEKGGQYFTPRNVCEFMGMVTLGLSSLEDVKEQGFITVSDPSSGSGAMILGAISAANRNHIDHRYQIAAYAVDVDIFCVHMCYVQLSLYGLPAVVEHADSLSLESWGRWYTPEYLINNWIWRAKLTSTTKRELEDELIKCWQQPMYGILVYGLATRKESENAEV